MSLTRRSLLAGGALAGAGLLTGCASTGTTRFGYTVRGHRQPAAECRRAADQRRRTGAAGAVQLGWLQRRGPVRARRRQFTDVRVGEMIRIVQTINNATGNPAAPDTPAFDACRRVHLLRQPTGNAGRPGGGEEPSERAHPLPTCIHLRHPGALLHPGIEPWRAGTAGLRTGGELLEQGRLADDAKGGAVPGLQRLRPHPRLTSCRPTAAAPASRHSSSRRAATGKTSSMQFGVTAGLQRGYNIVLFEGPGQMTPLFVRNTVFTPGGTRS